MQTFRIGALICNELRVLEARVREVGLTLAVVACDNNSAPDGVRSLVRFNAVNGAKYSVAMDGVNGAQGVINLNWRLGTKWTSAPLQTHSTVRQGGGLILSGTIMNVLPPPAFQWRWNGRNIAGATDSILNLSNLQGSQAGLYSLIVSNFVGAVTNTIVTVTVALPVRVSYDLVRSNGLDRFRLTAPSSQGLVVEASTDLMNWIPRYTNSAASVPLNFLDTSVPNSPLRFYRVMPWP